MTRLYTRVIRRLFCSQCGREFRGVDPSRLLDRHEQAHRSEVVLAVSCGANS